MRENYRLLFIIGKCSIEPLGIMYLSAILKKLNYPVQVYKYGSTTELQMQLLSYEPSAILFSATTGQHVELLQVAKICKEFRPNIKTIFGGPHPTFFPDVQNEWYIDHIIRGEADYSLPNLIKQLSSGSIVKKKDCSELLLPLDLDSLPFPDRSDIYKYPEYLNNHIRNVMTARGCPFKCRYCYSAVYHTLYKGQKIVRYRSPRNIIDECKDIISKYPTKMFFFADDEFSMDYIRLQEMAELYIKEVKLPFHCQVRIDVLDEKRLALIKKMGCISLTFAIETGNENLRKTILNRKISNKQIIDGGKLLRKYKIKFRAENMIGLPNETFDQMLETVDLNIKVKPSYAWVSIFQPFPGTELGDYCFNNGLFSGKVDMIKTLFSEDTALNMLEKDRLKLIRLQRLFGLIVEFPVLRPSIHQITSRGSISLYTKLRNTWKMHCYNRRLFKC